MKKNNPPDCYKCAHRGEVPGSVHSCCRHPDRAMLTIEGSAHGKARGWFFWPSNFDPVWLDKCNGFTSKEGMSPLTREQVEALHECFRENDLVTGRTINAMTGLNPYELQNAGIVIKGRWDAAYRKGPAFPNLETSER